MEERKKRGTNKIKELLENCGCHSVDKEDFKWIDNIEGLNPFISWMSKLGKENCMTSKEAKMLNKLEKEGWQLPSELDLDEKLAQVFIGINRPVTDIDLHRGHLVEAIEALSHQKASMEANLNLLERSIEDLNEEIQRVKYAMKSDENVCMAARQRCFSLLNKLISTLSYVKEEWTKLHKQLSDEDLLSNESCKIFNKGILSSIRELERVEEEVCSHLSKNCGTSSRYRRSLAGWASSSTLRFTQEYERLILDVQYLKEEQLEVEIEFASVEARNKVLKNEMVRRSLRNLENSSDSQISNAGEKVRDKKRWLSDVANACAYWAEQKLWEGGGRRSGIENLELTRKLLEVLEVLREVAREKETLALVTARVARELLKRQRVAAAFLSVLKARTEKVALKTSLVKSILANENKETIPSFATLTSGSPLKPLKWICGSDVASQDFWNTGKLKELIQEIEESRADYLTQLEKERERLLVVNRRGLEWLPMLTEEKIRYLKKLVSQVSHLERDFLQLKKKLDSLEGMPKWKVGLRGMWTDWLTNPLGALFFLDELKQEKKRLEEENLLLTTGLEHII